jgi:hypothetical protein
MLTRLNLIVLCGAVLMVGCTTASLANHSGFSRFVGFDDFSNFTRSQNESGQQVLLSPEIAAAIDWNELIVSWNAAAPAGTFLIVEARAIWPDHHSKFYTLGKWSPDNQAFPRTSLSGQEDADGTVATDTLKLKSVARTIQVRVTLGGINSAFPKLKYLGLSFSNAHASRPQRPPNQAAWGKIVPTPERSQLEYPQEKGWCSPTAVSMVLSHWAQQLGRPELEHDVPEVAAAVYDNAYSGTGNWPFNTAYAGSFSGLRSYVTRFDDLDELEDWTAAGFPVIISAPWNLLQPGRPDTGSGHLVVCIGFTAEGDVVVNDPATNLKTSRVRHIYRRADVRRAWASSDNTVYLIYPIGASLPADRYGQW